MMYFFKWSFTFKAPPPGAGKTGIDAVLHLLDSGLPADNITWVVPNDPWMTNRD